MHEVSNSFPCVRKIEELFAVPAYLFYIVEHILKGLQVRNGGVYPIVRRIASTSTGNRPTCLYKRHTNSNILIDWSAINRHRSTLRLILALCVCGINH